MLSSSVCHEGDLIGKLTEKCCELVQVGLTQGGANEPKAQDWVLTWTVYLVIIISLLTSVYCVYLCVNVCFSPPLLPGEESFTFPFSCHLV